MPLKIFSSKNFIGRNSELDALKNIAAEAKSGEASSILLTGSRGTGKSELLRHMYIHLFNYQNDAIPFFYTVKATTASVEGFSRDYFKSFIMYSLAFLTRDPSMAVTGAYLLQDLRRIAAEHDVHWASDMIDRFTEVIETGDPLKIFSYAVSAPYQSYVITQIPIVVMIDDFHRIKDICDLNSPESNDMWMFFENPQKSRCTPHVFAGFETALREMFFEESAFGEQLDLMRLAGLNRGYSTILFSSLCDTYGLKVEGDVHDFVNVFQGNPFYIKSFVQAARHAGGVLSEDNFWDIYTSEVTTGKIFTFWSSILKSHISEFNLRRPSLILLNSIYDDGIDRVISNPSEYMDLSIESIDEILGLFQRSGIIIKGFSSFRVFDDQVLADVIKSLYKIEIESVPSGEIVEAIQSERGKIIRKIKKDEPHSFRINIPSEDKAEVVAVVGLEHIAGHFNIPPDKIGQMQIALAELFRSILSNNGSVSGGYSLKYNYEDSTFLIEIETFLSEVNISEDDSDFIRSYYDDVKVEPIPGGTTIILSKNIVKDFVSA